MSFSSLVRPLVLASLAATSLLTAPNDARAQGLIDFLWGGTDEWGGKRQVVDFDPKYSADQVIVSFGDRRLYLITQKGKAISYPIAVPREQSRWQGVTRACSTPWTRLRMRRSAPATSCAGCAISTRARRRSWWSCVWRRSPRPC